MKWLEIGAKNVYISYFHRFGKNLLVKLKYLSIQYAWISIMKKQNSNQSVKVEKIVVLIKTFDHYHHKFQFFQLSRKFVKEVETEI